MFAVMALSCSDLLLSERNLVLLVFDEVLGLHMLFWKFNKLGASTSGAKNGSKEGPKMDQKMDQKMEFCVRNSEPPKPLRHLLALK
jgi:hypothetical protein